MKIKRFLAAAAASVVAVSAVAVSASAADVAKGSKLGEFFFQQELSGGKGVQIDFKGDFDKYPDIDSSKIAGVNIFVTCTEEWAGGAVYANSETAGWTQLQWGTDADNGSYDISKVMSFKFDKTLFAETDTYQQIGVAGWGDGITLEYMELVDASGNSIAKYGEIPAASTPSTPENSGSGENSGSNGGSGNVNTGVEGVAAVVGVAALAGAALVVARKRK